MSSKTTSRWRYICTYRQTCGSDGSSNATGACLVRASSRVAICTTRIRRSWNGQRSTTPPGSICAAACCTNIGCKHSSVRFFGSKTRRHRQTGELSSWHNAHELCGKRLPRLTSAPPWLESMKALRWYAVSGDHPDLGLAATKPGTRYLADGDPGRDASLNPARSLTEKMRRMLGREPL